MITEDQQASSQSQQQATPTTGSQAGSTSGEFEAKPSPSSAGDEYLVTNPFENQPRYDEDYDPPPMPAEQVAQHHQHQAQAGQPQAQQQQQQQQQQYYHPGYYNQHWQQQPAGQHYGHPQQQMYHQHSEYSYAPQHHGVHPAAHQPTQYHHMYPPNPVYPHHHPHGHPQQTSPNGPANTATPSPTTNSDDSGGDCVTESKRLLMAAHPHPEHVVPMSQPYPPAMHYPRGAPPRGVPLVQKRPRQTRRNKKKRDPNEPQKPVSAYALFFRDMQAGIKVRNPNASFGEVSKHVASMWDNLNPDHKAAYKKRTENAKKEYLKQLAAYRANLVSKNHHHPDNPYGPYASYFNKPNSAYDYSGAGNSLTGSDIRRHSPMGIPSSMESPSSISSEGNASNNNNVSGIERTSVGYSSPGGAGGAAGSNNAPNGPQGIPQHSPHHAQLHGRSGPAPHLQHQGLMPLPHHHYQHGSTIPGVSGDEANVCRRPGCTNTLIDFTMNGFCSNDCVLSQSREVYNNWSGSGMTTPLSMGPGTPPQSQTAVAR